MRGRRDDKIKPLKRAGANGIGLEAGGEQKPEELTLRRGRAKILGTSFQGWGPMEKSHRGTRDSTRCEREQVETYRQGKVLWYLHSPHYCGIYMFHNL